MGEDEQVSFFRTIFTAEEDESLKSVPKKIEKQLGQIPQEHQIRFSYDKNGEFNKTLNNQLKTWNRIGNYMSRHSITNFMFGDRRKRVESTRLFNNLKNTAIMGMKDYYAELDDLVGKDRQVGEDTKLGMAEGNLQRNMEELDKAKQKLDLLKTKELELANTASKLSMLPSEKTIRKQIDGLQRELSRLQYRKEKYKTVGDDYVTKEIQQRVETMKAQMEYLAPQMLELFNRGQEHYLNEFMDKTIKHQEEDTKKLQEVEAYIDQVKTVQLQPLKDREAELKSIVDSGLFNDDNLKELQELELKIGDIQKQLFGLTDRKYVLEAELQISDMELAQITKYSDPGIKNMYKGWSDEKLGTQYNWKMQQYEAREERSSRFFGNLTSTELSQSTDAAIDILNKRIETLEYEIDEAKALDVDRATNKMDIKQIKTDIKEQEQVVKTLETAATRANTEVQQIKENITYICDELNRLFADMNANPLKVDMISDTMQKMNPQIDKFNLRWKDAWKSIFKLGDGMKKNNAITRIFGRIVTNIRSRIARLLNPINWIKNAWKSWMDMVENKPLKNTFDMIKFNLTRVIAPVLNTIANKILKVFQYINVYTKKYHGIDLFDKSAWALDKMWEKLKKFQYSFDEFHAIELDPEDYETLNPDITDPLTPDEQETAEKWADWANEALTTIKDTLGKIWDFIEQHPWGTLATVVLGSMFGPAILSWLGGLLSAGLGKLFKNLFTGGAAAKGAEVAGAAAGGKLLAGLGTALKTTGGLALILGGSVAAWDGTKNLTEFFDTMSDGEKALRGLEIAGGIAAATLGGALVASAVGASIVVGGLVGAAIAGTTAFITWGVTATGHIKDVEKATEEYNDTLTKQTNAQELFDSASDNASMALDNLRASEERWGISAEDLVSKIRNGEISLNDLDRGQREVYQNYLLWEEQTQDMIRAQESLTKANNDAADAQLELVLANGKASKSWDDTREAIIKMWREGKISTDEAKDALERAMGYMSSSARKTFKEDIPAALQEGMEPSKYASAFSKFGEWISDGFHKAANNAGDILNQDMQLIADNFNTNPLLGIGTAIVEAITLPFTLLTDAFNNAESEMWNMGATIEQLKETEEAAKLAQDEYNTALEQLTIMEQDAGESAEELYQKVQSGEVTYERLTDKQRELYDQYQKVQEAMATSDDAMKTHIDTMASVDIEAGKLSGDYSDFINHLIEANERGEISTEDMQRKFSEVYAHLTGDTKKTFMEQMPNSIKAGIEQGSKQFMSTLNRMWQAARETWQRIKNLFKGNGFKTDAQVATYNASVNSYDVGTNYVPNDQLAMVHKGEAIVPTKFNPSAFGGNTQELTATVNAMTNEISQLRQLINQGIPVTGEFRQRGSDLVATVEKGKSKRGNAAISDLSYAR